jgi:hypothetical protein
MTADLDADTIMRLTADPALFVEAPFLLPMQGPVSRLHTLFAARPPTCCAAKEAWDRSKRSVAAAVASLVETEVDGGRMPHAFAAAVVRLLGSPASVVQLTVERKGARRKLVVPTAAP